MKKIVLLNILISLKSIAVFEPIELDISILKSLDGVAKVIDGNAIRIEYQVLNDIASIQFGKINTQTKKREGMIQYDNNKTNLKQLAKEETRLAKELVEFGITVKEAYHNRLESLPEALKEKIKSLKVAFLDAKNIFKEATFQFLDSIQHFKGPVIDLMTDCCVKRNKPESLILKWAEAAGNEEAVFHKYITTAVEFDEFLTDLTTFLRDLIHNCPRAKKQFEEWYLKKN